MPRPGAAVRLPFSKRLIEGFPAPAERTFIWDEVCPGLCLRLEPTGHRSFYFQKRVNGRWHKEKLGPVPPWTVEMARKRVAAIHGELATGVDRAEAKRREKSDITFATLFESWLSRYAEVHKREVSRTEDQRLYKTLLAKFHPRKISTITTEEVRQWHTSTGDKHGRYAANRGLALLSCVFSRANELVSFTGNNPARGVRRFPEQKRDRFLQPNELPTFFAAIDVEPDPWPDYFRLALLTGARRANLMAMRWQDIDLPTATWRIPAAAAKGGELIALPLVTEAVEILRRRQTTSVSETWVFPGDGKAGHLREIKSAWSRIVKRAGLKDLRPHDLRRTLGSWQAGAGVSTTIIGRSLGHAAGSPVTAIYARVNLDPVREAVGLATAAMLNAAKPRPK